MIEKTGNSIRFHAFFVASKVGVAGLTDVTVDVYDPDGTLAVTGDDASELGGGLYYYTIIDTSGYAPGEWVAIFKTADATVDQQHIPSLWVVGRAGVDYLTADLSTIENAIYDVPSLSAAAAWDEAMAAHVTPGTAGEALVAVIPTAEDIASAVWDEDISNHDGAGTTGEALTAAATDPLESVVPGAYADGTAGNVLGSIGTGGVVTLGPVVADGETLDLVRGDDYSDDESRAITFSSSDWPDLTGAVITMTVRRRREAFGTGSDGELFSVDDTASLRSAGGDPQSVSFEPINTQTDDLLPGTATGKFDVQATLSPSGRVVTLVTGVVNVTEDQTRVPGTLPPNWTLYGNYNNFGDPSGVTIYLWDDTSPTGDTTVTDAQGDFQFDGLTIGSTYGASDVGNPNNPPPTQYGEGDSAADNRISVVAGPQ